MLNLGLEVSIIIRATFLKKMKGLNVRMTIVRMRTVRRIRERLGQEEKDAQTSGGEGDVAPLHRGSRSLLGRL